MYLVIENTVYGLKPFTVGVDDVEGPPVPMPNTEVKLDSAENTRMVTSREDRKMPTQIKLSNRAAFFIS